MGQLSQSSLKKKPLFIITGPREIGKTSFIKNLIELAKNSHIDIAGVFSPAVFSGDQKVGIDLQDIRSGTSKHLANLRRTELEGIFTDRWFFSTEVMEWGNELLANVLPCDLLIIDELGPIEFERGGGWQNGIHTLNSGEYKTAIVVIRPELVNQAIQLWPQAQLITICQKLDPEINKQAVEIIKNIH